MLSLLSLYCLTCICGMSLVLDIEVIALCKYKSFLSWMFNSILNSLICPSSGGFSLEIGGLNTCFFL